MSFRDVGTSDQPLHLKMPDGTWRTYAGGGGVPLKVKQPDGTWETVTTQGIGGVSSIVSFVGGAHFAGSDIVLPTPNSLVSWAEIRTAGAVSTPQVRELILHLLWPLDVSESRSFDYSVGMYYNFGGPGISIHRLGASDAEMVKSGGNIPHTLDISWFRFTNNGSSQSSYYSSDGASWVHALTVVYPHPLASPDELDRIIVDFSATTTTSEVSAGTLLVVPSPVFPAEGTTPHGPR